MRGRETLDDIQIFLESVIIRCFTSKYTLLPKRREAVPPMDLDLWNLYKSQEDYFKGKEKDIYDFNEYFNQLLFILQAKNL